MAIKAIVNNPFKLACEIHMGAFNRGIRRDVFAEVRLIQKNNERHFHSRSA